MSDLLISTVSSYSYLDVFYIRIKSYLYEGLFCFLYAVTFCNNAGFCISKYGAGKHPVSYMEFSRLAVAYHHHYIYKWFNNRYVISCFTALFKKQGIKKYPKRVFGKGKSREIVIPGYAVYSFIKLLSWTMTGQFLLTMWLKV